MSKRSSKNAINFAGKNWSVGRKFRGKPSAKKNRNEKRDKRRKEIFDLICKKFDFKISTVDDKLLYDSLLNEFIELRAMKGSRTAKKSVENVDYFRAYCEKYKEKFDIQVYFNMKFNKIDFHKKFPNIILKRSLEQEVRSSEPVRVKRTKNSLANLISDEMVTKLKSHFKK